MKPPTVTPLSEALDALRRAIAPAAGPWASPAVDAAPARQGPPAAVCSTCAGSGLVAPDAFGDHEPWAAYYERCARARLAAGYPESSSAIAAGLIRPEPCPGCRPAESPWVTGIPAPREPPSRARVADGVGFGSIPPGSG